MVGAPADSIVLAAESMIQPGDVQLGRDLFRVGLTPRPAHTKGEPRCCTQSRDSRREPALASPPSSLAQRLIRRVCLPERSRRQPGAGMESDLHRHAHRHEYGKLVQSSAGRDRPRLDLRRAQRYRTSLHADLRSARSGARRVEAGARSLPLRTPRSSVCSRLDRRSSMSAMPPRSRRSDTGKGDGHDGQSHERGIAWGTEVARTVLALRANDGFSATYPAFAGGTAVGQWRPMAPATAMSAQALAFTDTFVLASNTQFQPPPPRTLASDTYADDFNAVKALGSNTGSTRTEDQTALAPFWEANASVHWNQAANQMARANHLSMSKTSRLLAALNIAMADTMFTIWSAKRFYAIRGERGDVAAAHGHHAGGERWQSRHGRRRRMDASHDHAVAPGVPCRTSKPQWRGGDGSAESLQRPSNVHAHGGRSAGSHLHQHQAGARRR